MDRVGKKSKKWKLTSQITEEGRLVRQPFKIVFTGANQE